VTYCIYTCIYTIVISTQHDPAYTQEQLAKDLKEKVIKAVVPSKYLDDKTVYHMNPSGLFTIGGPEGDGGLTGRKIIIDTYGGWGAHGGGAQASAARTPPRSTARQHTTAAGLPSPSCPLDCASAALSSFPMPSALPPLSPSLLTAMARAPTPGKTDQDLLKIIEANFDCRAGMLVLELDMLKPKYKKTACYSHFGNAASQSDPDFTWEVPKKLKL
jgi:S-adenosylmethionine synthetase